MRKLITLDEGLLNEFGGHFWMLQFLDLYGAEIEFMMFNLFVVYAIVVLVSNK